MQKSKGINGVKKCCIIKRKNLIMTDQKARGQVN